MQRNCKGGLFCLKQRMAYLVATGSAPVAPQKHTSSQFPVDACVKYLHGPDYSQEDISISWT